MRRKRALKEKKEARRAKLLFPGDHGGYVQEWKVSKNQQVSVGDILAKCVCFVPDSESMSSDSLSEELRESGQVKVVDLRAPLDGEVIERFYEKSDDKISSLEQGGKESQVLLRMTFCDHPLVIGGGLCAVCGRTPSHIGVTADGNIYQGEQEGNHMSGFEIESGQENNNKNKTAMTLNVDGGNKIIVSRTEAESNREEAVRRLIRTKKLLLVLDIDHTMLHATDDPRAIEFSKVKGFANELHRFSLPVSMDSVSPPQEREHFVILRPGLQQWLSRLKEIFELFIYTAGTRSYAEAVARIFDPTKALFGDRIISRTDVPELGKVKRLDRLFPIDNSMVLAVDDRSDVWMEDTANLITIRPFHFFIGMADVNNASGPEFDLEGEIEEEIKAQQVRAMDRGLKRSLELLEWIHSKFYANSEDVTVNNQLSGKGGDVKELVRELRKRILRGLRVTVDLAFPEQQIIEHLVSNAGGQCVKAVADDSQVVIARDPNCKEALEGKARQVWVVHPHWLHACIHNWNKEPYEHYTIYKLKKKEEQKTAQETEEPNLEKTKTKEEDVQYDDFGYPIEDSSAKEEKEKMPLRYDDFGYPIEDEQQEVTGRTEHSNANTEPQRKKRKVDEDSEDDDDDDEQGMKDFLSLVKKQD